MTDKIFWDEAKMQLWVQSLKSGQVVAAPAEGVYGYCADPFNDEALKRLIELKRRDKRKGLIVLVRELAQLDQLIPSPGGAALEFMREHWPTPAEDAVTLILHAKEDLPYLLTGGRDTIAVRLPACDYMQEYLVAWDRPLVSTSLNFAGDTPALTAQAIPADVTALTLEEPLHGKPSRILDTTTGVWVR